MTTIERPDILQGFTQCIETGMGKLYLTINELDGKPIEIFATIGKSGKSTQAKTEAIGRMASLCLRSGVSVDKVIEQMDGIIGEHPIGYKTGVVQSIPDAIARVLTETYIKKEKVDV